MRKTLLSIVVAFAFMGCGDDGGTPAAPDASESTIDAGDDPLPTCAAYCDAVEANCAAPRDQWSNEVTCLDGCAAWAVGTIADQSGNTLGCRLYHAGAAAGDPATHCVHSGPGGAGACGSNCEGFCTLALETCSGGNEQYADLAACMADCATFDQTEPYDVTDTDGDSFACRLYHLTAAIGDPVTHCDHIVEASAPCQ